MENKHFSRAEQLAQWKAKKGKKHGDESTAKSFKVDRCPAGKVNNDLTERSGTANGVNTRRQQGSKRRAEGRRFEVSRSRQTDFLFENMTEEIRV